MAITTSRSIQPHGEFRTANAVVSGDQTGSVAARLIDGGYVAVWETGGGALAYRYFNADGTPRSAEVTISSSQGRTYSDPSITSTPDGRMILAFQDTSSGGVSTSHYIASPGPGTAPNFQSWGPGIGSGDPDVTFTGNGWVTAVVNEAGGLTLVRWTDQAPTPQGTFEVVSGAGRTVTDPSIATLADGGWVVGWSQTPEAGGGSSAWVRRFNADGVAQGAAMQLDVAGDVNESVRVEALPDGGFVAVWISDGWASGYRDVSARLYNANGTPRPFAYDGNEVLHVNIADVAASSPSVAVLADGLIAVTWSDAGESFVRLFNSAGELEMGVGSLGPVSNGSLIVQSGSELLLVGETAGVGSDVGVLSLYTVQTAIGDDENDTFAGGFLRDIVEGRNGDDTLSGGDGDDDLNGGFGDDRLLGGAGADVIDGSVGYDTASWVDATTGVVLNLTDQANNAGGAAGDHVVNVEVFELSNGADIFIADRGGYTIRGLGGDDLLVGANDVEVGDLLIGGAGADVLQGGLGADTLEGGAGADVFAVALGDSTAAVSDVYRDFTSGEDVLDLTALGLQGAAYVVVQQSGGGSVVLVDGDANGDFETRVLLSTSITAADIRAGVGITAIGDGSHQVIRGTALNDALAGGGGNDQIAGGAGADSLYGQDGEDVIYGQDGGDFAYGGAGADALVGGLGADSLLGEDGNDSLFGQEGADLLIGGEGSDGLYGGQDADSLLGGNGLDSLVGEDGNDNLFGQAGADLLSGGAGLDTLFGGDDSDVLIGGSGADTLNGEQGADELYGQEDADTLVGGDGNDIAYGGSEGDALYGGEGADTLNGEAGGDLIVGGGGADLLIGGEGADRFVYTAAGDSTGAAADLIVDFAKGIDVIDLSAVDANTLIAGDQVFAFVGAFTGVAGQARLSFDAASGRTLFQGDANGDGVADLVFLISGNVGQADGFIL